MNESLTSRRKQLMSNTKKSLVNHGFKIGKEGCSVYSMLGQVKVGYLKKWKKINSDGDIKNCLEWLQGSLQTAD